MIERLQLLRNIGQFDNVSPGAETSLTPITLVYSENGRGKTTLAAIFRSLATGNPNYINERHRLGAQHPPHVVLNHFEGQIVFQDATWSRTLPEVTIFDDTFVSQNICSGIELRAPHRQKLHELILGAQGVALNVALQGHVRRIEEHNTELRNLANAIPAAIRGPYSVDAFCKLEAESDIDTKVQDAERRLAAARSADTIRLRSGFTKIALPDFPIEEINRVLGQGLEGLEVAAVERVRTHLDWLGDGGESWIADGVQRMDRSSDARAEEICPFCSQSLEGVDLIANYRAYFGEEYDALKQSIRDAIAAVRDAHGGDVPAAFERDVRTGVQTREFWRDFVKLPEIDIDTAAIARDWNAARDGVLARLRAKAAAPLEPLDLDPGSLESIRIYRRRIEEVSLLSDRLVGSNTGLDLVKEQAAADDLGALRNDLTMAQAQKARFKPAVALRCDAYVKEKIDKAVTEQQRDQARADLDRYRERIFPAFETAINGYLRNFGATFRLGQVQSVNTRGGSSASYCVVINGQNVNVTADEGPSFRNTLSAGDRSTLALAFFFASLEQGPDVENKVVVIDDPMTSLDEHRALQTRQEIIGLAGRVQQVIVLSHSKPFLCGLWEQTNRNGAIALRINRVAAGSEVVVWDVRNDSVSEHDKRHELVREYLVAADPDKERQVAEALRPVLEAFMRVAYPEYFPPGKLLGPFVDLCERRLGADNEVLAGRDLAELRALLVFSNQFHHDTNPAWQTTIINDAELTDFAGRTLRFASRR